MTEETSPRTRRMEPGLTRRLSMGMGTLTLAGAAFFGVADHLVNGPENADSASVAGTLSPDDPEGPSTG